jgi:hypothetical protein
VIVGDKRNGKRERPVMRVVRVELTPRLGRLDSSATQR